MLILVIVVLYTAFNEGLIGKAKTATTETEKQVILEQLWGLSQWDNNGYIKVKETIDAAKESRNINVKDTEPLSVTDSTESAIVKVQGKLGVYSYKITTQKIVLLESEIEDTNSEIGFSLDSKKKLAQIIDPSETENSIYNAEGINVYPILGQNKEELIKTASKIIGGKEVTTLKEFDVEYINKVMESELTSYDDVANAFVEEFGLSREMANDPELVFTYISVFSALKSLANEQENEYIPTSIEEFVAINTISESKQLKINNEDVTDSVDWIGSLARFTTINNGEYNIELSINGKNNFQKVQVNNINSNVGLYVKYDNKIWQVMYDEEELKSGMGAQIVSNEIMEAEAVVLGENDSMINWQNETVLSEADLDEDGELSKDEKKIYSYNNAIYNLNKKCESLVSDKSKVESIRCIGSNPINPYSENTTMFSKTNIPNYVSSGNKKFDYYDLKLKSADNNRESDCDRLGKLTGFNSINKEKYWLASRGISADEEKVKIGLFERGSFTSVSDPLPVVYVNLVGNISWAPSLEKGVHPVITLNHDVLKNSIVKEQNKFDTTGTSVDNPFIIK